jgi:hypothetical protein
MIVQTKDLIDPRLARQYGKDYVKILTQLLLRNNVSSRAGLRPYPKVATGNLVRSINYRLVNTSFGIQTQILALDYLTYVDKGRRPGTYPPIKPLLAWAQVKGLPKGVAYGARNNIFKYGIKPTNVIKKTTTLIENSRDVNRKYEQKFVNNLVSIIEKNYNAELRKYR